ncbi:hypothetical protein NKG05_14660 [Oerskovia sp. M15]
MTAGTTTARTPFVHRVKEALTGDATTPLVFLGNFEVEDEWAHGEIGLPSVRGASASSAVVNRMDEFALLLAGKDDHVVLKSAPDPGYLAYLDSLGLDLPQVLVTDVDDPLRTVTRDALDSPRLQARLREVAADGARLLAHGTSTAEEELCAATGLASALPDAATTKTVNSKVYSRELCAELGIRQARGGPAARSTTSPEPSPRRRRPSPPVGPSGSRTRTGCRAGDPRRRRRAPLEQLLRMVVRRAERSGDERISVVIEEWADKATDLNYHFTVALDGRSRSTSSRRPSPGEGAPGPPDPLAAAPGAGRGAQRALRPSGRAPPSGRLPRDRGRRRHPADRREPPPGPRDQRAQQHVDLPGAPPGAVPARRRRGARAPVRPDPRCPVSFDALAERLGDLLYTTDRGHGLLVDNTATVNAAASTRTAGASFSGGCTACSSPRQTTSSRTSTTLWPRASRKEQHVTDTQPETREITWAAGSRTPAEVTDLAARFGTPLYLYDGDVLTAQFRGLRDRLDPAIDIYYSLKANPNVSVCGLLHALGAKAEVSSLTELHTALTARVAPQDILFLGPGKSREEIVECLTQGVRAIICESFGELELIDDVARDLGTTAQVVLRVNPPSR